MEIDVEGERMSYDSLTAQVENYYSSCSITRIKGEGTGEVIVADPNTNLLYPMTRIPAIRYQIHKGRNEITTEVKVKYGKTV